MLNEGSTETNWNLKPIEQEDSWLKVLDDLIDAMIKGKVNE